MDNAGPKFDHSSTRGEDAAFDSPSSDSAESNSPTSTLSADSWGERIAAAATTSSSSTLDTKATTLVDSQVQITVDDGSETTTVQKNQALLVVPDQGGLGPAPSLDLPPNSPFSPGALLQSAMDRGAKRVDPSDDQSNQTPNNLSPNVDNNPVEAIREQGYLSSKKEENPQSIIIDYEKLFEQADARPKDDDEEGEESEVEDEEENLKGEKATATVALVFPRTSEVQLESISPIIPQGDNASEDRGHCKCGSGLLAQNGSDLPGMVQATTNTDVTATASTSTTTTVTAVSIATATSKTSLTGGVASTSAQQLASQWRRDQSTSHLIQRPDGSMFEHVVPHETFSGSQFLEKRQKKHGSQGRLSSTGSLTSAPKKTLMRTEAASSSSLGGGRLESPVPGGKTSLVFGNQISTSEDDTPLQVKSDGFAGSSTIIPQKNAESKILTEVPEASSAGSTTSPSMSSSEDMKGKDAVPTNKRPAKIDTTPLEPGKKWNGESIFKSPLDKYRSSHSSNSSGAEPVVMSKVSRKGKLFAQKVKTIANFEYNTSRKLGKGNFGIVYQGSRIAASVASAKNNNASQSTAPVEEVQVAIKKITRKLPGEIEKLGLVQREMKVCRLFKETVGVVPLLDIITTGKHHYLVFEKADGDLAEMIKDRSNRSGKGTRDPSLQPLSPSCSLGSILSIEEIRGIMRTVVLGVQSLHKEGYSHKDIKPANILHYRQEGLLCDFGLCSRGDDLPKNQFFGTQDYAAPEARRVSSHRSCDYIRSDIYSLGAVLYELATGQVLSKVISQGLNWQKMAQFGGRAFSELLQGMLNDIEKRWDIERVVNSRFWSEDPTTTATPATPVFAVAIGSGAVSCRDPAAVALPKTPRTPKFFE
ncbi:hypothetical protein BGZ83_000813 [Gryganskiella cystojenkinii]|nr:hypothetical protein BGZ83_000813 [Gryganskiella cystojenkinii]